MYQGVVHEPVITPRVISGDELIRLLMVQPKGREVVIVFIQLQFVCVHHLPVVLKLVPTIFEIK